MIGTAIEWADHTINYWWGCQKVSEGCKFCYAESLDARFKGGHWGPRSSRKLQIDTARKQLAKVKPGERVFVNSMGDTFEAHLDLDAARAELFADIVRRPDVVFMLLTKRPENVAGMVLPDWMQDGFPRNVWLGVSVENQAAADKRIPSLLAIGVRVRFLSCEPLLGQVDLSCGKCPGDSSKGDCWWLGPAGIHWVIVGGESGRNARPMEYEWVAQLRDQCVAAGVAFHFKQWGGVNKKAAGRLLDGIEWNQLPTL